MYYFARDSVSLCIDFVLYVTIGRFNDTGSTKKKAGCGSITTEENKMKTKAQYKQNARSFNRVAEEYKIVYLKCTDTLKIQKLFDVYAFQIKVHRHSCLTKSAWPQVEKYWKLSLDQATCVFVSKI